MSDIALYIPPATIGVETIVEARLRQNPRLERYLRRAVKFTGQKAIRFPAVWEDTATMAAQAVYSLVKRDPKLDLSTLRYLTVGTETPVDLSKPVAAYVEGMLQNAGLAVPPTISTYQVQHACAGGTLSLLAVGALLSVAKSPNHSGLVITSDIARYDSGSSAEITQGAGAAAILVERNPRLVELNIDTAGYVSKDVDDFFHPLNTIPARVKGQYSIQCYQEALEEAFLDHCRQREEKPEDVLRSTDFFVLHVPFRNLPVRALGKLVSKILELSEEETEKFLADRGFEASVEPAARIGNIYAGSIFLALAFLLEDRWRAMGDEIVGKSILLGSYGSGNTMVVVSGKIAPSAPEVIARWNLEKMWEEEKPATLEAYSEWQAGPYDRASYHAIMGTDHNAIPPESFFLASIREDDYREYRFHGQDRTRFSEGTASRDLCESR